MSHIAIPDYPHDRAQWMSSQIQFQLSNPVEPVSPFSMSSALPLLKRNSSVDIKSIPEVERPSASTNQANISYVVPDASDYQLGNGRGHGDRNSDSFGLPAIPELSWSARLSAAEADNGHSLAGSHVHLPNSNEECVIEPSIRRSCLFTVYSIGMTALRTRIQFLC
jgi:hypothetical protein